MDSLAEKFGQLMRHERRIQDLTLRETAKRAGLTEAYVCRIEKGDCNVSLKKALDLSRALGIAPRRLGTLLQGGQD